MLLAIVVLFAACASAEIAGRVLDPNGEPVAGASVELLGAIRSQTRTDAAGRFRLAAPPDGQYTLLASAPGFSGRPTPVAVAAGNAAIDLPLQLAARRDVVVVTAERAEMPASTAASATTVISRAQLEEMHAQNLADALRLVPGLSVNQTGGRGGQTSLFARGGDSRYNLVMIDGVPVNDFGGSFNFANVPIDSVERIEVVRGPQSALYGLNAIGSVVHVITRMPDGPLAAHASVEGGSFSTSRTALGAAQRLGRLGYSVNLSRESSDGTVPNDHYRNEAGSLHLEFDTSRSSRLRYTLLADANDIGAPGPYAFAPVDTQTRGKENSYTNGLEFEWRQGRFLHKLTTGFYNDHVGYVSGYGPYETTQFRVAAGGETSVALNESDTLAIGFDYQHENFRNTFVTDQTSQDFPLSRNNLGWYVENRYQRGGRFFLNAGVRVQSVRTAAVPADAWGSRPAFAAHNVAAASPKVSAAFLPGHGTATKLHASAGTGLRAADGFELAFTNNGQLRPERTRSFDAGIERQFFRRRAVIDATYFYNRYHDLIVTLSAQLAALSRFQSDNLANSRAQGLELSGALRPAAWISLDGHYTWVKSELLALDGSPQAPAPFRVGQQLLRRPEHAAAYTATWRITRLRLTLNTGAVMRSEVLDVHPLFGPGGGLLKNPGYIRPDAGVEFAVNREVALYARLYNFTDERYQEALGFPSLRRNFIAGIKFRWR